MADASPGSERTVARLFTWRTAISESCLKPVERHCLLALSLYMNERGGSAYPGSTRLAHDTGYHVDTVKRALAVASSSGWLRIVVKGGSPPGQPRRATEYVAHVPVLESDRGHTITGGPDAADWGSSVAGPGVHGLPITSMNSPKNTDDEVWKKDEEARKTAAPAPWVVEGVTRQEWQDRHRAAS